MELTKEIALLRGLAQQYAELCASEENKEHYLRCKAVNDLQPQRPPVWIDEVPWNEMNFEDRLTLTCEDPFLQKMEWFFKEKLYRWVFFRADMYLPPYYPIGKSWESSGIGVKVVEDTEATDNANHIVSHHYFDELDTEEKLARLHLPVITAHPEKDAEAVARAEEILDGILPVRLCGTSVYHCPWDDISMLRGVEPILIDMMDRPEFLHQTMEIFTQIGLSKMEQLERLGLLDSQLESLHCTPPFTDDLPQKDAVPGKVRTQDVWFRAMAQMFSTVSPAAFEEFEFQYMKRLAEKCGLTYYGCCEPLDRFMPILKTLPNLRKCGVSPWSNVRKMAEELGGNYVYARKPNPANVGSGFNEDTIRAEIRETIEACLEHKCPYEFVLKDISTVAYRPQNLFRWSQVVQETIDEYYR